MKEGHRDFHDKEKRTSKWDKKKGFALRLLQGWEENRYLILDEEKNRKEFQLNWNEILDTHERRGKGLKRKNAGINFHAENIFLREQIAKELSTKAPVQLNVMNARNVLDLLKSQDLHETGPNSSKEFPLNISQILGKRTS